MALNLGGWFGCAIVGTLHTFYPSLTSTQLRYPRLQGFTFIAWTAGVTALALATAGRWHRLRSWAGSCSRRPLRSCWPACAAPLNRSHFPALTVGVAQPFLLAALVLAAFVALSRGPGQALSGSVRASFGTLLVVGWIGLTVVGSLLHLLAVLIRVRGGFSARMPVPRPRFDSSVAVLAVAGVAGLALSQAVGLDRWELPASAALLLAYAILGTLTAARAARILVSARPRI